MVRAGLAVWSVVLLTSGAPPAAQAADFPLPEQLCDRTLEFGDGGDLFRIAYCANHPLGTPNEQVKRALIVIPGSESAAKITFDNVLAVAEEEGRHKTTTIWVPSFLEDDGHGDTVLETLGLPDDYLYWSTYWRYGDPAKNGNGLSSYELVDAMVLALLADNPNLEHIAIVGHSAGGRFVNRYAAGTWVDQYTSPEKVTLSFGVFAPGQVLYLDNSRPYATDLCDNSPTSEGDFRRYPDGLIGIESHVYMAASTALHMRDRLFQRRIYYTVGTRDNIAFPPGCDAVQGTDRLDLQRRYREHLTEACIQNEGGDEEDVDTCDGYFFRSPAAFGELPGVRHSHRAEYRSRRGRDILFHWK